MKRDKDSIRKTLARYFSRYGEPSQEDVALAVEHVWQRLEPEVVHSPVVASLKPEPRVAWPLVAGLAAAAAVVLVVLLQMPRGIDAYAVVESADGSLSRISGDKTQIVHTGERIEAEELLRTNDANGSIALADGSRVELRSQSEFLLERAADGVRIRLNKGSIIVNAAKQRQGHLYVQTKDMTVSVVGTVFVVKAEEEGSRVAVIEGEVRVQRVATAAERLLTGEQVATDPLMAARPVSEEISWSRHAREHLALLLQSPVPATNRPGAEPREAFEVASVRPAGPLPGAGPRGGGGAATTGLDPCPGPSWFRVDPSRFAIPRMSLYFLIAVAYGNRCPTPDTLTGGPDWVRSDMFAIEAKIPEGTPIYTKDQLLGGNALKLQRMLQGLLADRFKLVLRREMKEMPAYNLVVGKDVKVKLSAGQTPDVQPQAVEFPPGISYYLIANVFAASPARFANNLQRDLGRPVFDKTGLKGLYDFLILFPDLNDDSVDLIKHMREELPARLEEQLGLKLESTRALVEVLVIEHAERPTPN